MLLYNYQIIDYFTLIEFPLYTCTINVIIPKGSNKNNINSLNLNSAYNLNSPIFS